MTADETQEARTLIPLNGNGKVESRFKSRKFAAFMVSNILWKAMIGFMVFKGQSDFILMTAIIVSGCVDIGYILGQAALDAFLGWATRLIPKEDDLP